MTKVIILSIQSQHAVNILKGFKTEELRKNVPKGFRGWVYIYVSRGKDRLSVVHDDEICKTYYYLNSTWGRELNGEVVARFWFDEYDTYYWNEYQGQYRLISKDKERFVSAIMSYDELCLNEKQVNDYGNEKHLLYTWHIKHLEIFDNPIWLKNFYSLKNGSLKKPPISWQYVYVKGERK